MTWLITPALKNPAVFASDPDARAYLLAVEQADGQFLEAGVVDAINAFVIGCKADGIWNAIKASCILAGARTLTGALVPLVGTAPTNENFVSGDYNRETGLLANGTTKSLNSNRNRNADPTDSFHISVYASAYPSSGFYMIGDKFGGGLGTGWSGIYRNGATNTVFANRFSGNIADIASQATGFMGSSRSLSTSFVRRIGSSSGTTSETSGAPSAVPIRVFSASSGAGDTAAEWCNARLAFYSIGESLDLALLDTRVTTLINAFAAAIP
jgi:hypothetical protein